MKFTVEWENEKIDCEWFDSLDLGGLKKVKQVSAYVFDKEGRICLVHLGNKGYWTLPGGSPEKEETYEETLIREIEEEADLSVKDLSPIGYLKNTPRNSPDKYFHQVRFIAMVDEIKPQTKDPANDVVPTREFVNKEKFLEYLKWNGTAEQLDKAIKAFKSYRCK